MLQAYLAIGALALYCLNPFEVREVLQVISGRQISYYPGLNPFEVREVLQVRNQCTARYLERLNPFEVREVLQGFYTQIGDNKFVSIPLKSGRCCKQTTLTRVR